MLSPTDLARPGLAFAAALLLACLSAAVEGLVARRGAGLRRRRGFLLTGGLADAVKLLARRPAAGSPWRAASIAAALLPVILLAAAVPEAGGVGLSQATPAAALPLSAGLALVSLAALAAPALGLPRARHRPLAEAAPALLAVAVALALCVGAVVTDGGGAAAFAARPWPAWGLLRHPLGLLAFLGSVALASRSLRRILGVPLLPGDLGAPGLAGGAGAGTVWLLLGRHLWVGALTALAAHVYLGAGGWPAAGALWLACVVLLVGVALLREAIVEADAEGLARLAWTRLVPLAALDAVLAAARQAGVLPWT